MVTSFSERNGKWTYNANVRQRTGSVSIKPPPRLWTSKEDAEKDVGLFVWYSSVRDKNDPAVPYPHGQWFKTMLPNDSWNDIGAKYQTKAQRPSRHLPLKSTDEEVLW